MDEHVKIPSKSLANIFSIEKDSNGNSVFLLNKTVVFKDIETLPKTMIPEYYTDICDNLYKISYKLYGNISYWWVIAKLNNITDVTQKFKPNTKLRYVPVTILNSIISSIKV